MMPVNPPHSEIVYLKLEKYTQCLRLALTKELQWNSLSASQQILFGYVKYFKLFFRAIMLQGLFFFFLTIAVINVFEKSTQENIYENM